MISVITGDIINSRNTTTSEWLDELKYELNKFGSTPKNWEIYRGDSFQLEVENILDAFLIAVRIKATVKTNKNLDVRMAIGTGEKNYDANVITESNGSAFINSGEKFESLKKEKQNLAIKSDWKTFDREMNLYLKLGLIAMDNWTINAAETIRLALEFPHISQKEIGQMLGIQQNAVSNRLKRAYFDEVLEINEMYKIKLKELI